MTFLAMEGIAGRPARDVTLDDRDEVVIRIDDDREVDAAALREALSLPRREVWTGALLVNGIPEPYDHLGLWLTCAVPGPCRIVAPAAAGLGLMAPLFGWGGPAACDESSFAYLSRRPVERIGGTDRPGVEVGVVGHGPGGAELAARVADRVRTWDREHHGGSEPLVEAYPAGTPDEQLSGAFVIDKPNARLAVTWPAKAHRPGDRRARPGGQDPQAG